MGLETKGCISIFHFKDFLFCKSCGFQQQHLRTSHSTCQPNIMLPQLKETPWRRFSRKRVINQTLEKRRVVREWKTNWKMARNGGSSLDEASRTQNQHGISPVKGTSIAEGKKVVSSKVSWTENERVRDVKGKSIVLDDDVVDQAGVARVVRGVCCMEVYYKHKLLFTQ